MNWIVTIDMEGPGSPAPPDQLMELTEALRSYSPSVTGTPEAFRGLRAFGATLCIDEAETVEAAVAEGRRALEAAAQKAGLGAAPVVRAEAMAPEVQERLNAAKADELLGVKELAALLGVSRQRVAELEGLGRLPRPVARLGMGPVWSASSVRRFIETWDRRGGKRRTPPPAS